MLDVESSQPGKRKLPGEQLQIPSSHANASGSIFIRVANALLAAAAACTVKTVAAICVMRKSAVWNDAELFAATMKTLMSSEENPSDSQYMFQGVQKVHLLSTQFIGLQLLRGSWGLSFVQGQVKEVLHQSAKQRQFFPSTSSRHSSTFTSFARIHGKQAIGRRLAVGLGDLHLNVERLWVCRWARQRAHRGDEQEETLDLHVGVKKYVCAQDM